MEKSVIKEWVEYFRDTRRSRWKNDLGREREREREKEVGGGKRCGKGESREC